jgi:hypothetical protein
VKTLISDNEIFYGSSGSDYRPDYALMNQFSDDEALNCEYHQFLSVTVAVYIGGGLFFLVILGLILRFECPLGSTTTFGWLEFLIWFTALLYSVRCAERQEGVFRLLDEWEQSLLRRKQDLEELAIYCEDKISEKKREPADFVPQGRRAAGLSELRQRLPCADHVSSRRR